MSYNSDASINKRIELKMNSDYTLTLTYTEVTFSPNPIATQQDIHIGTITEFATYSNLEIIGFYKLSGDSIYESWDFKYDNSDGKVYTDMPEVVEDGTSIDFKFYFIDADSFVSNVITHDNIIVDDIIDSGYYRFSDATGLNDTVYSENQSVNFVNDNVESTASDGYIENTETQGGDELPWSSVSLEKQIKKTLYEVDTTNTTTNDLHLFNNFFTESSDLPILDPLDSDKVTFGVDMVATYGLAITDRIAVVYYENATGDFSTTNHIISTIDATNITITPLSPDNFKLSGDGYTVIGFYYLKDSVDLNVDNIDLTKTKGEISIGSLGNLGLRTLDDKFDFYVNTTTNSGDNTQITLTELGNPTTSNNGLVLDGSDALKSDTEVSTSYNSTEISMGGWFKADSDIVGSIRSTGNFYSVLVYNGASANGLPPARLSRGGLTMQRSGASSPYSWELQAAWGNNNSAVSDNCNYDVSSQINDGDWHHYAYVKSGTTTPYTHKLYVDGVEVNSYSGDESGENFINCRFAIGASGNSVDNENIYPFKGIVKSVFYTEDALDGNAISSLSKMDSNIIDISSDGFSTTPTVASTPNIETLFNYEVVTPDLITNEDELFVYKYNNLSVNEIRLDNFPYREYLVGEFKFDNNLLNSEDSNTYSNIAYFNGTSIDTPTFGIDIKNNTNSSLVISDDNHHASFDFTVTGIIGTRNFSNTSWTQIVGFKADEVNLNLTTLVRTGYTNLKAGHVIGVATSDNFVTSSLIDDSLGNVVLVQDSNNNNKYELAVAHGDGDFSLFDSSRFDINSNILNNEWIFVGFSKEFNKDSSGNTEFKFVVMNENLEIIKQDTYSQLYDPNINLRRDNPRLSIGRPVGELNNTYLGINSIKGSYDNVLIYDRAMSELEIKNVLAKYREYKVRTNLKNNDLIYDKAVEVYDV